MWLWYYRLADGTWGYIKAENKEHALKLLNKKVAHIEKA